MESHPHPESAVFPDYGQPDYFHPDKPFLLHSGNLRPVVRLPAFPYRFLPISNYNSVHSRKITQKIFRIRRRQMSPHPEKWFYPFPPEHFCLRIADCLCDLLNLSVPIIPAAAANSNCVKIVSLQIFLQFSFCIVINNLLIYFHLAANG